MNRPPTWAERNEVIVRRRVIGDWLERQFRKNSAAEAKRYADARKASLRAAEESYTYGDEVRSMGTPFTLRGRINRLRGRGMSKHEKARSWRNFMLAVFCMNSFSDAGQSGKGSFGILKAFRRALEKKFSSNHLPPSYVVAAGADDTQAVKSDFAVAGSGSGVTGGKVAVPPPALGDVVPASASLPPELRLE